MDVFALRDSLIRDYRDYIRSFITIRDPAINDKVDTELARGPASATPSEGEAASAMSDIV